MISEKGAKIWHFVQIREHTMVRAGSVVTKDDIPPFDLVFGSPARLKGCE